MESSTQRKKCMYTFKNTERTNKKALEFETKSLLYLVGQRSDKAEISVVSIDCFNDVTGICQKGQKLWDVQSKGEAGLTPRKIGRYLITLFKNYDSEFTFFDYILFLPKVETKYLKNSSQGILHVHSFTDEHSNKIKAGLIQELDRLKVPHEEQSVNSFLEVVCFVEDRKSISTYVKDIIRFRQQNTKENKFYEEIFKEIRDLQSVKKNSYIENEEIQFPNDVMKFNRHILTDDLKILLVNRFVGVDLFDQKMMPPTFLEAVRNLEVQDLKDLILDCKSQIARAFFDKNQKREFWSVFEHIVASVNANPDVTLSDIYGKLSDKIKLRLSHLNELGIKFLSAMIKDGLTNEN